MLNRKVYKNVVVPSSETVIYVFYAYLVLEGGHFTSQDRREHEFFLRNVDGLSPPETTPPLLQWSLPQNAISTCYVVPALLL